MVERDVFSDDEEESVFDHGLDGGVDEHLVSVPAAVERLGRSAGRGEAAAESRGVATLSVSSETDALHELISDELKEI
ncbi:hypothetical protein GN244_ATG06776 [Phytophthora infestans]|uniref:Uncharacterized protein n=1 Tax=Phytophthora infestans TaxID=4787 RepID=A0A833SX87_PHYIN|nr:hypothetical protein GN244_ATG06776 [Phytophthora infestans]